MFAWCWNVLQLTKGRTSASRYRPRRGGARERAGKRQPLTATRPPEKPTLIIHIDTYDQESSSKELAACLSVRQAFPARSRARGGDGERVGLSPASQAGVSRRVR